MVVNTKETECVGDIEGVATARLVDMVWLGVNTKETVDVGLDVDDGAACDADCVRLGKAACDGVPEPV